MKRMSVSVVYATMITLCANESSNVWTGAEGPKKGDDGDWKGRSAPASGEDVFLDGTGFALSGQKIASLSIGELCFNTNFASCHLAGGIRRIPAAARVPARCNLRVRES